jgi:hypothetical protein
LPPFWLPLASRRWARRRSVVRNVIVVFYDDERDVDGLAAQHGRAYGAEVSARYHSALKGYAATIPQARIDDVRRDPRSFVSDDRDVEPWRRRFRPGSIGSRAS